MLDSFAHGGGATPAVLRLMKLSGPGPPATTSTSYDSQLSRDYAIRSYALQHTRYDCALLLRGVRDVQRATARIASSRLVSYNDTRNFVWKICDSVGPQFGRNNGHLCYYGIHCLLIRHHWICEVTCKLVWANLSKFASIGFSFWIVNKLSCPERPIVDKGGQGGQTQLVSGHVAQAP